jgi:hypothetical protein
LICLPPDKSGGNSKKNDNEIIDVFRLALDRSLGVQEKMTMELPTSLDVGL